MSDQHTCDWCGCTCRATDYDSLRVEVERLTLALHTANSNHEHFEREWYLRGDAGRAAAAPTDNGSL